MKIVVCIKQVPDTTEIRLDPVTGTLIRDGVPSIMNPDTVAALKDFNTALELDKYDPDAWSARAIVRLQQSNYAEAESDLDRAIHLSDRKFAGADTLATSNAIAGALRMLEFDLVITGRQAIDGDTAQVGPQIAEKLHLPQVTYVTDIKKDGNSLIVKRQLEDGYMELKVNTPCLLTCIKELNTPRYMSVSGIFECYDKPVEVFDYNALKDDPLIETDTIGLKGSPTNVYKSFAPPVKGAGMMVEDAAQLVGILNDKHLI